MTTTTGPLAAALFLGPRILTVYGSIHSGVALDASATEADAWALAQAYADSWKVDTGYTVTGLRKATQVGTRQHWVLTATR